MSRLARPAARLATGSAAVARGLGARLTTWVARGRRHDLTGWRAALGCWLRLVSLMLGVYLLWRLVRAVPALMWLLSTSWAIAAWRSGRRAPTDAKEKDTATPDVDAVRTLLLTLMGDGSGVHLRTVLAHLQEHGHWEDRTVTDLRAHLQRLGIPHDRGVKVAGVPTWGVRRRDLEAPSPAATEEPSTAPSTAA
ncbi:hypothetical protein [Streptomyces sp. NK08204]|uniref:hypothetical protein n=1 Tax=Streptomyces sp. NK08204 TaxID=2873260 RepID=UPI001CED17DD|nr:hypothetical protein [Streptomyces sp. NK08204]